MRSTEINYRAFTFIVSNTKLKLFFDYLYEWTQTEHREAKNSAKH